VEQSQILKTETWEQQQLLSTWFSETAGTVWPRSLCSHGMQYGWCCLLCRSRDRGGELAGTC